MLYTELLGALVIKSQGRFHTMLHTMLSYIDGKVKYRTFSLIDFELVLASSTYHWKAMQQQAQLC